MAVDPARAKSLFLAASDLAEAAERAAYLDRECGGDPELLARVEGLLRANDASPLPKDATGAYVQPGEARAQVSDAPAALINTVIAGKYKLVEVIGEGGMGDVYMAQQAEPIRRAVAVKVIKAGMDSKAVLARFEAERQALAMMDHPNIARVLDAGVTNSGRPFFVMELIKGVPITGFCDAQKLTLRQRLELFVPVCQAIQHAHQKNVIHRDIKPSNVLVALFDDRPVPKVIDFGVAKAVGQPLTDLTLLTGFGAVVGTPEYMSPEQASFNQVDVDTRSDVYALGVLLYELLAGSPPFTRKELEKAGVMEMLRVIREKQPSKPSTKLSTADGLPTLAANRGTEPTKLTKLVRGELDWIVMKALEKDRTRRYETAKSFAMDVQRYLADKPVQACPPSAAYRLQKFVRRNRTVVLLSTGLALLAAAIAVGSWFYGEAARESDRTRRIKEAHEKIPLIQAAIRQGRQQTAFDLLNEVEPLLSDQSSLHEMWEQCSQTCSLKTDPPDADIWRRPYDLPDAPWLHVIRTTDRAASVRVPRGEYLWRATKPGYREVTGLRLPHATSFILDREDAIPADMVRIPAGQPNLPGMANTVAFQSDELPDFLIDRYEVTNGQYDRFVKAGGYDNPDYWQDLPFVGPSGTAMTWGTVKPLLVDQTGRPGPANWRDGTFKLGEENHPVRGVSWYEATAFARFAGKSLPTIYHWAQATQVELSVVLAGSPFITSSNFGASVKSVSSLCDPGAHGTFGTMGNVKEWCHNAAGDGKRFILGGGCGEPIYVPLTLDSSHPLQRDEFFGFRCAKFFNDEKVPTAAWGTAESIPWTTPPKREDLMDAATFRLVVQDRFTYDKSAPLDVTSEQIDEGEWIHISAQINTAYRDAKGRWERMPVHLYLPKGIDVSKGYQTVVYFPGGDAHMLPRIRPLAEEYGLDAIVRSGRAVLRPVYQGMYERPSASSAADSKAEEEERGPVVKGRTRLKEGQAMMNRMKVRTCLCTPPMIVLYSTFSN
jgi:serine/threonine protein kinase/formylglycine-generating enzyme required for sulfatase activity